MAFFKKRILEREVVEGFLSIYESDVEKVYSIVLGYIKNSASVSEKNYAIPESEVKATISMWFVAVQLMPVLNLFEGETKTSLYTHCMRGVALMMGKDEQWLMSNSAAFYADFQEHYSERKVGRWSQWLLTRLYGEPINDLVLLMQIDLITVTPIFKWKEFSEEYRIVVDVPASE